MNSRKKKKCSCTVICRIKINSTTEYGKGIFKFSPSGNRMVLAGKTSTEIFIYDSSDILKLMDDIKHNRSITSFKSQQFKTIKKICFSGDDSKLCIAFSKSVSIYDLETASSKPSRVYEIPD